MLPGGPQPPQVGPQIWRIAPKTRRGFREAHRRLSLSSGPHRGSAARCECLLDRVDVFGVVVLFRVALLDKMRSEDSE